MSVTTRGFSLTPTLELVTEECCSCGITFAMPREFQQQCLKRPGIDSGKPFYCPNGHKQWYTGKTDADKLREARRQLEHARADAIHQRDQRQAAERSNQALRGVITRTKRRIAAGVCPCCRRHFNDLQNHMEDQHPGYVEQPEERS